MLCIGLASSTYILAQDVTDAVRYSMDEIQGTARFRAMSGAFGALGGDMSAVNINPAGSAIFNNSHASASIGFFSKNDDKYEILIKLLAKWFNKSCSRQFQSRKIKRISQNIEKV